MQEEIHLPKEKNKKWFFKLPSPLLTVVLVSLIVGALSGGVAGIVTASFFSGSFKDWLNNPLGLKFSGIARNNNQNNNLNQPQIQNKPVLENEEDQTTSSVAKVSPAVVSIVVSKELQQYYSTAGPNFNLNDFFNMPFDQFFNSLNQQQQQQQPTGNTNKQTIGGGTGFLITADGLILTNRHVVEDTTADYSVVTSDGKTYDAKVIARDPLNDFAFLKVEGKNFPVATLGDSDKIKVGQTVIAIGFSLGQYSNTVTKGIISGTNRDITASGGSSSEQLQGVIQTDAAINPGNSGGPLINLNGEVIGINTAINQSGQLIGFAIPINNAKQVINNVKTNGKIVKAYLGVRYVVIDDKVAADKNLPYNYGGLVIKGTGQNDAAVMPGSPADKAGLLENDIILEVNGVKLQNGKTVSGEIGKYKPGDTVSLKVFHQGKEQIIKVVLGDYPQ